MGGTGQSWEDRRQDEEFFNLSEMMKKSKSNIGEVIGLSHLDNIKAIKTNFWYDTGNLDSLKKAQVKFKSPLRSVLEKENEAIWFLNNKVYKFHVDENFISQRVRRYKRKRCISTEQL